MILTVFLKFTGLPADRDSNNSAPESQIPPIIPRQMCALRPGELYELINVHKERLTNSFSSSDLDLLKD